VSRTTYLAFVTCRVRILALDGGDYARPPYGGLGRQSNDSRSRSTDTRARALDTRQRRSVALRRPRWKPEEQDARAAYDGLGKRSSGLVACGARHSLRSRETDTRFARKTDSRSARSLTRPPLTMLCRCHGPRIYIHIRINLDGSHFKSCGFEEQTGRGRYTIGDRLRRFSDTGINIVCEAGRTDYALSDPAGNDACQGISPVVPYTLKSPR
jgi:hypothetical protein